MNPPAAVNRQKQLDKIIEKIELSGEPVPLLLHCCCAPCSSYVLDYLSDYFNITAFFYNPNIYPLSEYEKRKAELIRLINTVRYKFPVVFADGDYREDDFLSAVRGTENCAEGGERCRRCFLQRLSESAQNASELGIGLFASTLSVSPHKDAALVNETGEFCAEKYGVSWLPSDFKKRGGYKKSVELSKIYRLYRQNYCGCRFSITDNINIHGGNAQ